MVNLDLINLKKLHVKLKMEVRLYYTYTYYRIVLIINYIFIFLAPQTVPELVVTSLSPISLHVEWSAINVNLASGTVSQYHIMWRQFHSASNYIQILHKDARQYTITGSK